MAGSNPSSVERRLTVPPTCANVCYQVLVCHCVELRWSCTILLTDQTVKIWVRLHVQYIVNHSYYRRMAEVLHPQTEIDIMISLPIIGRAWVSPCRKSRGRESFRMRVVHDQVKRPVWDISGRKKGLLLNSVSPSLSIVGRVCY